MFAENLKDIMQRRGVKPADLSQMSGIGKSSISQYLSGKNVPSEERIKILANTLDVQLADLVAGGEQDNEVFNVPVELAAKLMHKKITFVYEGLKQGVFPWGYAVKTSGQWSYYISSKKFTEYTGIPVTN